MLSWIFIFLYGIIRFIEEFFREPDLQIGYYWNILTQGQIFSTIMVILGGIMIWKTYSDSKKNMVIL